MRTVSRLRLLLFSVNDNSVGPSIFVLIAMSILKQAHHNTSSMSSGIIVNTNVVDTIYINKLPK